MARSRRKPEPGPPIGRILATAFVILIVFSLVVRYGDRLRDLERLLPGRGGGDAAQLAADPGGTAGGESGSTAGPGKDGASRIREEPAPLRLQILNATGLNKLALETGESLRAWQVDALDRGNAPSWPFPETILVLRSDRGEEVGDLARRLGGVPVVVQRREDLMLDATLVLGHDWRDYEWPQP